MGKYDFGAEPLPKVKCISSNCEEDLHCFRPPHINPDELVGGNCHFCDANIVDWERMHKMDLNDVENTFEMLKKENIRNHFWNIPISETFRRNSRLDVKLMDEKIIQRLKKSVFCQGRSIFRDGSQTPSTKWDIIFFAQHATATCCRKCIKYWYGVPYDRELSDKELKYFKGLIINFIEARIGVLIHSPNTQIELDFETKL
jgi:hypothetical protein